VASITIEDTEGNDAFENVLSTLSADDVDSPLVTYGLSSASASNLAGYQQMNETSYGTLYLNTSTGAYLFDANEAAINALDSGESETLTFNLSAYDGNSTDDDVLTVTIYGEDEVGLLAEPTPISYADTAGWDTLSNTTGTLDVGGADATFMVAGGGNDTMMGGYDKSVTSSYGKLYLNSSTGAYLFDPNDAAINALTDDSNPEVNFAITATSAGFVDTKNLTVNLTGADDTPTMASPVTINIADTTGATMANVMGVLAGTDVDSGALQYSLVGSGLSAYGTFSIGSGGNWVFDPDDVEVNSLAAGDSEQVSFTVAVSDGNSASNHTVNVVVMGVNDAPIASSVSISTTGVTFYVADPDDGAALVYGPGFSALGAATNNDTNTVTAAQQSTALFGPLSVTDGTLSTGPLAWVGLGTASGDSLNATGNLKAAMWGFGGNDTLAGSSANDMLVGGTGADSMNGGAGADTFVFASGDSTLSIGGAGNSGTISGYDQIGSFQLSGTDRIDTAGIAMIGTGTNVNGTDSSLTVRGDAIKSHNIVNGIVSFDDSDTFSSPLALRSYSEVAAAVQYLQANNLGGEGTTVMFVARISTVNHTFLYTQGSADGSDNSQDVLVQLVGTNATGGLTHGAVANGISLLGGI
jgi:VCBS repeat-containing protein